MKTKKLHHAVIHALGVGIAATAVAGAAQAQTPQKPEKIEVTGSNIKRIDTETSAAIQVITKEDIQRSGTTTIAELLREIPAISGGSAQDFGGGTGFQRGNQTASLRGLGSVATLVLLNGRRITPAPYADPNLGQGSSYNLNSIPVSAIERVEVLKDGASAIYGSDAIAGVVNIILRKDYKGGEVSVTHWEKTEDSTYKVNQVSGSVGFGDLAKDRWNVLVAADWWKRDAVPTAKGGSGIQNDAYRFLANRDGPLASAITSPANLRRENVAGNGNFSVRLPVDSRCPQEQRFTVVAGPPAQVECRMNTFDFLNVVSESERKGVLARATLELSGSMTAFAEASFNKTETRFAGAPPGVDITSANTWFAASGQRFRYQPVLPVGHPDNPNNFAVGLRYRFLDLGPTYTLSDNESSRFVGGMTGVWGAWEWEAGILYSNAKREETSNGSFLASALQSAISSGSYRFDGRANDAAVLATLNPPTFNQGESKLTSLDLKASREVFEMPGGPAAIAAGVEFRKEEMDIVSDPRTVAGQYFGLASSTVHGDRRVISLFSELALPFSKNIEGQLAARYDRYSDFGTSITPKAGIKWKLTDSVAARATYARGFRAPSLFQISESNVQAFNSGIQDPVRCPTFTSTNPDDCNRTISSLIQANKDLEPEESSSYTMGVLWSPSPSFSTSLDLWYINRTDFIDRFDSGTVIRNEFNPNFTGGTVQRDPNPATWLPGVPNSGPILSTTRKFDNFGGTVVKGVDFDLSGSMSVGSWGKLALAANVTYFDKVDWKLGKNVPAVTGAGNFYVFESPRVRGNATLTWSKNDWSVFTRYNYVGEWFYGDPATTGGADGGKCYLATTSLTLAHLGHCYVESWGTTDIGVNFKGIRNLSLTLVVRNVEDKAAPYDPNQTTLGFNPTHHNPYGRYMSVSANYKFK
jgi:iron complex outermembrane receptor protein